MLNTSFLKLNKTPILLALVSIILYAFFAYDLIRTDYIKLISLYIVLFILFYKLTQTKKHNFRLLVIISFLFRLVFLLAIPNLSQDFYRFIWDGNMILSGLNPYLTTPDYQMNLGIINTFSNQIELYNGMGKLSASHFTNYPPINQLCFVIANLFPGSSILSPTIGLRLIIIAADFGTLYFGKKLLEKLKLPVHNIFWYLLNPFIIIELTGNLHFEAVMIFFLIWSLYLLHIGKWKTAAIVLALSISVKLIPLIFLPLLFQYFLNKNPSFKVGIGKLIIFYAIVGFITIVLFSPFLSVEFINNYVETVGLWFQKFEFNASIYYIVREIGYLITGWNEIAVIGKVTPVVVIVFILIISFFRKNKTIIELITVMLLVLSFYYFTATTVHPWYLATLVILSIFTKYKFPLVWSFIIIISYLAYANSNNTENLWIIGLEYLIVYVVVIREIFMKSTLIKEQNKGGY
ncbi:MAG: mannosyltransferase [Flavobacteriaceae bacterium]|nr:mannosyltransferase [Flavobacteriaceae bacterium]